MRHLIVKVCICRLSKRIKLKNLRCLIYALCLYLCTSITAYIFIENFVCITLRKYFISLKLGKHGDQGTPFNHDELILIYFLCLSIKRLHNTVTAYTYMATICVSSLGGLLSALSLVNMVIGGLHLITMN